MSETMSDDGVYIPPEKRPACQRYMEISKTTLSVLRKLDDAELERRFDELMINGQPDECPPLYNTWQLSPGDYTDELNRRAQDREATTTRRLSIAAVVIAVMTMLLPLLGQAVEWFKELMACPWPE